MATSAQLIHQHMVRIAFHFGNMPSVEHMAEATHVSEIGSAPVDTNSSALGNPDLGKLL